MATTNIEWAEQVWNPIAGCTPVSPGCLHCYAARMSHRLDAMHQEKYNGLTVLRNGIRTFNGKITLDESALTIPLRRKNPTTYFVNSMSDLFHEGVPFDFIDKVFAVMALCPQHKFMILTKRSELMAEYSLSRTAMDDSGRVDRMPQWYQQITEWFDDGYGGGRFFDTEKAWDAAYAAAESRDLSKVLSNVWLGTSVENRAALERITHLAACPAAIRFVSFEPLLEDLGSVRGYLEQIDLAIVGGESGPGARRCNIEWIRSIIAQCKVACCKIFVKQLGKVVVQPCHNCGRMTGNCAGGMVDACGPGHAQLAQECFAIKDSKGGDMSEWPMDLRIRELPAVEVTR